MSFDTVSNCNSNAFYEPNWHNANFSVNYEQFLSSADHVQISIMCELCIFEFV